MIDKLNTHYSFTNPASVYDEEALTALELAGRTTAKVNEVVDSQNQHMKETKEHLQAQDNDIKNQKETVIPNTIKKEVDEHIQAGEFDKAIDKYAGNLEARVNNLLGSLGEGSTTGDAELIDIRTDISGNIHTNAGEAVRSFEKIAVESAGWQIYPATDITVTFYQNGGVLSIVGSRLYFMSSYNIYEYLELTKMAEDLGEDASYYEGSKTLQVNLGSEKGLFYDVINKTFSLKTIYSGLYPAHSILLAASYYGKFFGPLYQMSVNMDTNNPRRNNYLDSLHRNIYNVIHVSNNAECIIEEKIDSNGSSRITIKDFIVIMDKYGVNHTDNLSWTDLIPDISNNAVLEGNGVVITVPYRHFLCFDMNTKKLKITNYIYDDDVNVILYSCGWSNASPSPLTTIWLKNLCKKYETRISMLESKNESVIPYDGTITEYGALFNNSGDVEPFIFFADPHLCNDRTGTWRSLLPEKINYLKKYANSVSVNFCLCAGDWYGMMDTQEKACEKMGAIHGIMQTVTPKYYSVLGNHDTNYQGGLVEGERWTGRLSQKTIDGLWFRNTDTKKAYYTFNGSVTKFYVFDTGTENEIIEDYQKEQLAWFAGSLEKETSTHIALAYHIHFYSVNESGSHLQPITEKIIDIANAYNNKSSIEVDGVYYDFTEVNGKIHFALCGHTHRDFITNVGTFNVIETLNAYMQDDGNMHFDLCIADYTNNKLHLIRVGDGENREVEI